MRPALIGILTTALIAVINTVIALVVIHRDDRKAAARKAQALKPGA